MKHWYGHWLYRSENFLKNKFNGVLQKLHRKISHVCNAKHKNPANGIKLPTIMNLMNFPEGETSHSEQVIQEVGSKNSFTKI